jgi:hypothetical protein
VFALWALEQAVFETFRPGRDADGQHPQLTPRATRTVDRQKFWIRSFPVLHDKKIPSRRISVGSVTDFNNQNWPRDLQTGLRSTHPIAQNTMRTITIGIHFRDLRGSFARKHISARYPASRMGSNFVDAPPSQRQRSDGPRGPEAIQRKSRHQRSADDGLKFHSPAEPSAAWLMNGFRFR